MPSQTAKVAISMPKEVFRSIEQARRELKMPRSAAIVKAVRVWLRQREKEKLIRQYVEGYRKYPEKVSPAEAKARMRIAAMTFQKGERW